MNKKASADVLQLAYIIDIIIGAIVAFSLIGLALTWNSFSKFNEIYIEQDLSLLLDSTLSSPSKINIVYPISTNYKLEINGRTVNAINQHDLFSKDSKLILNYNPQTQELSIDRITEND